MTKGVSYLTLVTIIYSEKDIHINTYSCIYFLETFQISLVLMFIYCYQKFVASDTSQFSYEDGYCQNENQLN
jgi:hypothetical protein